MDTIDIGGKKRPVRFNFNAYSELEDLGFDILGGMDKLAGKGIKFIKALAYVGLKYGHDETGKADPGFDIKDVGAWIKNNHANEFIAVLNKQSKSESEGGEAGESHGVA